MDIDCVIIGLNVASSLASCLESLQKTAYRQGRVRVFYVDGGSVDQSCLIAQANPHVQLLQPQGDSLTPGLLRNVGWQAGGAPLVQFLDADSILSPHWWTRAVYHLSHTVAAVRGRREERHPAASPVDWVAAIEWNPTPGNCDAFGAEVLILRSVLQQLNGYDEALLGYEDRELSYRITDRGYLIMQLDAPMAVHDLAMTTPNQYWRKSYRTGYGFAAVTARHRRDPRGFWIGDLERIAIRGGGAIALLVLTLRWIFWTAVGLLLLLPVAFVYLFPRTYGKWTSRIERRLSLRRTVRYAWHCSFVALPQFVGVVRYYLGRAIGWPLRLRGGKR